MVFERAPYLSRRHQKEKNNYIGCKEQPISLESICLPIIKARQEKFVPKTVKQINVAKAWQANYFRLQYSTKGQIDNPYPKVKHLTRDKASRLCGNKEM